MVFWFACLFFVVSIFVLMCSFTLSWRGQSVRGAMASVYNPSGKLCSSNHRLRILNIAFQCSQLHQPETHKHYGHPDFPTAIARLPNKCTNKASHRSKRSKLANQCTTPDIYMQAFRDGVSPATERFASPLNFNPNMTCYFSMYAEDARFGANCLQREVDRCITGEPCI